MTQHHRKTQELADHYVDQLSSWAKITTRPLFGAVALYRQKTVFAMVWRAGLYFKVDGHSRSDYEVAGSHALGYASEGEQHGLKSYWEVPADVVEDHERLQQWAERAYRVAAKSAKD
ncbi:TfoX/Sxy family transcriptional regulator [Xanthomonas campestris]|uniref:TfoX/Sxy family protein n=1 Tax=Xanthomonas campestris TaxID=339 RepID=UPI000E1F743F|nr:TfoX/Sxy family protein [Xanthomonas campestris]MCC5067092.1 TfoX/Sxy family protein [Xanthomonas campestris]MCC5087101.1 TfoX/Sxy family protein [Xanthomonas campestris]RJU11194.1 TfoX/Sxy family transcriptional regulator [Xanthomonas campestris]